MLEIYAYDIRNLLNKNEYETRLANASSCRKEKINKCTLQQKALENLAAAAVIDEAVKQFGLREKQINYGFGEVGKPYIKSVCKDADSFANNIKNIHFNISHSGDYAVCVVSDREVGIDIQKIEKPNLQVAKRFFAKKEYEYILNQPDEKSKTEAFYRIWTLKESFVKAVGVGINLPFDSFEFDMSEEKVCLKQITGGKEVFDEISYSFKEVSLSQTHIIGKREDELYKMAVCVVR